ncbi:hypothetical protein GCM10010358_43700 [Streptomyces minutiscleroticus]|uniref:Uncharacterized protein n=1 Tax=Streptomyces minutiscleroticus TaxID=68238 RepID=A0A918NP38_9ACTN|nr:hypothetical protein [Streptomyces minutiscleroticus]GGX84717.1 hypothetical protein GCM10010358_43700 [Streptomyces minutiscleroticus]
MRHRDSFPGAAPGSSLFGGVRCRPPPRAVHLCAPPVDGVRQRAAVSVVVRRRPSSYGGTVRVLLA